MIGAQVCAFLVASKVLTRVNYSGLEAGCSQEEGPRKGFVMGSRTRSVQEILEKCM